MTYEAAKKRAELYAKIVEELPEMRGDTLELVKKAPRMRWSSSLMPSKSPASRWRFVILSETSL
jgi:hypothetical protein